MGWAGCGRPAALVVIKSLSFYFLFCLLVGEKSCIRETPNLLTDADRRTDTEINIQGFTSSFGVGLGGGCCALYSRALVYIFIH